MTDDEAKNQALSEAIELAVSQNRTTVVIDGVDYLIQSTSHETDVPEDAARYIAYSPDALPATDTKTGQALTTIEAVNPGIKITLKDYCLDSTNNFEGPDKLGNLDELGVNSENTLKFSPGGQGITSAADYNKWQEGVYLNRLLTFSMTPMTTLAIKPLPMTKR